MPFCSPSKNIVKGNGRHGIDQLFYTFVDVRTAIKDKCLRACVHIDATTQAIVDASVVRITQLLSLQSSQTYEHRLVNYVNEKITSLLRS